MISLKQTHPIHLGIQVEEKPFIYVHKYYYTCVRQSQHSQVTSFFRKDPKYHGAILLVYTNQQVNHSRQRFATLSTKTHSRGHRQWQAQNSASRQCDSTTHKQIQVVTRSLPVMKPNGNVFSQLQLGYDQLESRYAKWCNPVNCKA